MSDSRRSEALPLRALWHWSAFFGGLTLWAVLGLLFTLLGFTLRFVLPRRLGMHIGQRALYRVFRMFIGYMKITGIGRFDLSELETLRTMPPVVIAPNHPSLFDAVLIVSRLPRVACTMKTAVLRNPFLAGGAALAGYVAGSHPKRLIHDAVARLAHGSHVLVFPEGTRTVRRPINPLRGSFVLIAKRANVPIQTVFIEANSAFLGKEWGGVLRKPEFPLHYRVRLGRRFDADAESHLVVAAVQQYFEHEFDRRRPAPMPNKAAEVCRSAESASDIVMH